MPEAKRLDALQIGEVSGVDHPAHLAEGWSVLKSLTGLSDDDMAEVVAEAQAAVAKSQPPSKETVMTDVTPTDSTEDVFKSLPEPVRKALKEAQDVAVAAVEELKKERGIRADVEAVAKAKSDFAHIPGLDPVTFGPLLRKAAEAAPEEFAEIVKALSAADAALAESVLFKEVGSSVTPTTGSGISKNAGTGTSVYSQVQAIAKGLVADGTVKTEAEGIAKAFTDNTDLYAQYTSEKMEA